MTNAIDKRAHHRADDMDDSRFGDSNHCIDPSTTLLPALLKKQGYATHAIGKWDVGYIKKHCTPTFRGYDTFLGYWTACTSDYWYHGAPGGNITYDKCGGVDLNDAVNCPARSSHVRSVAPHTIVLTSSGTCEATRPDCAIDTCLTLTCVLCTVYPHTYSSVYPPSAGGGHHPWCNDVWTRVRIPSSCYSQRHH